MEENNQYCVGCLGAEEEFNLKEFTIQCEPLKATLQVETISLCYICHRLAQHAELFIQNVQSNQILLENFHDAVQSSPRPTIQSVRAQAQSSITLSQTQLTTIEVTGTGDEESCSIIDSKETNIKLEPKEEGLEQPEEEFIDGNDDSQNSFVKEEDDPPLNSLLQEIELDSVDLKSLRTTMGGKNDKKKCDITIKKSLIDSSEIYTFTRITEKQYKKEREDKARQESYQISRYKCENCIKGFILQESYDRHMEKHSKSKGKFICNICKLRFNTSAKLRKHKYGHTRRYKCLKCDLVVNNPKTIKNHFSKHTNNLSELKCPHCPKIFTRLLALSKHKYYAHSGRSKVACEICQTGFVYKGSLRAHRMRRHPEEYGLTKEARPIE